MGNSIIADDIKKTPGTPWRDNQNSDHLAKIAKVETSSTFSNYEDGYIQKFKQHLLPKIFFSYSSETSLRQL